MDGIHDMGGMQGWGTVSIEPNEPTFHARWEGNAFVLSELCAQLSHQNPDSKRHAIELQHPLIYLSEGYYGRFLSRAETFLIESALLAPGAVEARVRHRRGEDVEEPPFPLSHGSVRRPAMPGSVRATGRAVRFAVGEEVRTKTRAHSGHTRLARYIRGHRGTVAAVHPAQVFPDTNAHFIGENPQPVYAVRFESTELWGDAAESFSVTVDCFDDYLVAMP